MHLALWVACFGVVTWMVMGVILRILTALQCLLIPGSLRHSRQRWNAGMDTLIFIQSLGALSPAEREKLAEAKWAALQ